MTTNAERMARVLKTSATLTEALRDQYRRPLHRYLLRRLRDAEIAGDLEQEVYLRLLRVANSELVRDPQAYMYRIASNVVYEFRQRERRDVVTYDSTAVEDWDEQNPHVELDPLAHELDVQRRLDEALSTIKPRWRAAYLLHMRDGMTHAEVAEALQISIHTVKKHILSAFLALRTSTQQGKGEG